ATSLYWKKYLRSLAQYQHATKLIAISEASKHDYVEYISSSADISVIHHGVTLTSAKPQASTATQQLAKDPYLLYVGGIDLRKNVVSLIQTFYTLKPAHPDLRLLLIGKEFSLRDQLDDLGWSKALAAKPDYAADVLTPGFMTDSDLAWLYSQAMAFVFPS